MHAPEPCKTLVRVSDITRVAAAGYDGGALFITCAQKLPMAASMVKWCECENMQKLTKLAVCTTNDTNVICSTARGIRQVPTSSKLSVHFGLT